MVVFQDEERCRQQSINRSYEQNIFFYFCQTCYVSEKELENGTQHECFDFQCNRIFCMSKIRINSFKIVSYYALFEIICSLAISFDLNINGYMYINNLVFLG